MTDTRVGLGFDVHQLVAGRPCWLGGILFDHPTGPSGHSDGDAVLHAVADAVLGAAGLDDLGSLFPDTDAQWKDANSADILSECLRCVHAAGWALVNLDIVIATEGPRIAPRRADMRARLAELLEISSDAVNVKGKTFEGLGALAAGRGVAVQVVAMLQRRNPKVSTRP